jgi:hypothetical protein
MARKRYKPEEIVAKLRQVDVLVRAIIEPKPGRITGSAGSRAVPHERNVPAGAQGGPQGRGVFLGSGIFRHNGRRDPQDEQHDRQDAHRLLCIQARPVIDRRDAGRCWRRAFSAMQATLQCEWNAH